LKLGKTREVEEPTSQTLFIHSLTEQRHVEKNADGRFSGGTHGFGVGHITPEAFLGGPLALVKTGDEITIDAQKRTLTLHIESDILARRRQSWTQPVPRFRRGVLAKYAAQVADASHGAVTDKGL